MGTRSPVARLLEPLTPGDRERVLAAARRRTFARNEVVFWVGDPGECLHLITSGHAAAEITTPRGDTATVRILGPGEHFGELAIVSPGPRSATIRALTPLVTLVISFDDFAVLRRDPEIEAVFVEALATEIRRLAAALADALYLPAADQVWKRLAEVEAQFAGTSDETVLPLTQSMLATFAGVTRQTLNKFLDLAESRAVIRRDSRGSRHGDRPGGPAGSRSPALRDCRAFDTLTVGCATARSPALLHDGHGGDTPSGCGSGGAAGSGGPIVDIGRAQQQVVVDRFEQQGRERGVMTFLARCLAWERRLDELRSIAAGHPVEQRRIVS